MSRIDPGMAGAVVRSSNEIVVTDGKPARALHVTLTPEQFEQMRQGFRCIACFAVQETPFPQKCIEPYCNFNLERDQMTRLQFEDRGEEDLWPTHDPDIWTPGGN